MRSAGSASGARSGHSISATVPSGSGDRPISSSSDGIVDAVEVGMDQRKRRQFVGLRERESRARHFQLIVGGEIADHRARRGGLAGAEIARQRDDVAGADQQREIGHQMRGRGLVRQRDRECGGCRHSAALRCAVWSVGKSHVTVVPLPTIEIDAHLAAMQFDKGAHQRQPEAGAAMPRAVGMAFEPVEHLVLDLGRNARAGIGHGEDDAVLGAPGADRHRRIMRREADGVGEQIIEHLHHAPLVAGEIADIGIDVDPSVMRSVASRS